MEHIIQQLQFLDFDDIDSNEVEFIQSVLYSLRSPRLELPWVEQVELPNTHWNQHHHYEGNSDCPEGGGEVYPVQVPVATTIQQVYHQVVPSIPNITAFMSNLTANVNVHGFMQSTIPYHPVYQQDSQDQRGPGRRQRSAKPSPKRNDQRRGGEPSATFPQPLPPQYSPQPTPYPIHVPLPPAPYQYLPQAPHIPSAQHATGPPLYLTPMYPTPHHLYGQYQPAVFSPHLQQQQQQQQPPQQQPPPPPQPQPQPQTQPQPQPPRPETAFEKQDSFEKKEENFGEPKRKIIEYEDKEELGDSKGPEVVDGSRADSVEPDLATCEPPTTCESPKNPVEAVHSSPPTPTPPEVPEPVIEAPPPAAPPEKPATKSLPPINAIKTTALPSLPPVKRKQLGEEPVVPPVAVSSLPPAPSRTWAGLFKDRSTPEETAVVTPVIDKLLVRKPPINAVAVTPPPPRCDPPTVENSSAPLPPRVVRPSPLTQSKQPSLSPLVKNSPSQDLADDPALRRIGEALSQYQLEHKAIVLTPRGLTNPSNYCYINATLQALLACPPFYNLIKTISVLKQNSPNSESKLRTPVIDSMTQFIKEFSPAPLARIGRREKALARKDDSPLMDIVTGTAFEPSYVYKMLHALRNDNSFQVEGRQEDAEEFLSLLLNGLHDEMLELTKLVGDPKASTLSNGDVTNGDSHQDDTSDWKEVTNKGMRITRRAEFGRTPLSDIFMGQLRCSVHRAVGASEPSTDNIQPFFTLQLDIESSESVNEALEKLVGWDPVEGVSSGQTETWQQQSLDSLPYVLILHLKCFHYRQQTCSKIVKTLEFPIDLRLEPRLLSNKIKSGPKTRQYKLFAVVYHDGKEASKGHYLSDVFHVGTGGWIRYDDSTVQPVSETQVLHPRPPRVPYLLYYRRADTVGPHHPPPSLHSR